MARYFPVRGGDPGHRFGATPGEGKAGAAVAVVMNDRATVAQLRALDAHT